MNEREYAATPSPVLPPPAALRLLPWADSEGKPCYLSTDDNGSMISRLADEIEATQTSAGAEVLRDAEAVLADPKAGARNLRQALTRTVEALSVVLRVAESRGARLPVQEHDGGEDAEPPADAMG
ncbi:hypothetical protein ACFXCZ_26255 [Streptomyces sp. NPDC059396]|uniref:hypothetical protein n=1 Tax=Streptomyces sp. NPDC059396 TaxID=3346819 RepID=UPI0036C736B6